MSHKTKLPDPTGLALGRELEELRKEVDNLKSGQRAVRILQGMITSGHIAPESIDAEHLAALIVLASTILVGTPGAARLELNTEGITQFDQNDELTFKIGHDPADGNFLTVKDPTDPTRSLASISDEGLMTASGFNLTGNQYYNGDELSTLLARYPKGVVCRGELHTATSTTTSELGIMELRFTATAGRMYRIHGSGFSIRPSRDDGRIRVRYTTNSTRPTISSTIMAAFDDNSYNDIVVFSQTLDKDVRLLFTVSSKAGVAVYQDATTAWIGDTGLNVWVEDIGPWIDITGVASTGGGSGTAPTQTYVKEYPCTWSRAFRGDESIRASTGEMVQGYYDSFNGDNHSCFGFDHVGIQSDLSGATINKCELWLYSFHWYWNWGGYARIRSHNSGATNTYPGVSATRWIPQLTKPGGLWIDLGTAVGNEFKNNTTKGFALDARDVPRNLQDYGKFDGDTYNFEPKLRITYTK